ncbi:MAG: arginyl-tRNA synthetase [Bacteroidetes bacterium]|nr:arginyl-tRNA synthetase [Bacteroidota bacterium]
MNLEEIIQSAVTQSVKTLYNADTEISQIQIQKTKKEFEGDVTIVVFPFVKMARKSPEVVGQEIGEFLLAHYPVVSAFNVIKGFLNVSINKSHWIETLNAIHSDALYGTVLPDEAAGVMMIEYSSPNTNKPLHLGHIRNNLLGHSISEIQKANGWNVVKTNIVNDRGIHICKSMLAWKLFGNGETPQSSGLKGDHLVGKYYVIFDKAYKAEIKELMATGMSEEEAKKNAPLILDAQKMLLAWENNDKEVRQLWEMMNGWVYAGFDETYQQMGVSFDKIYYESETYLTGKAEVERGVDEQVFYRRDDSSVWADLTADGLDEKLLLRADGTSVYMTQDIGTAKLRYNDFDIQKMVYVVGNEQNYHFQVLSILLDKLGFAWGKSLVHFSYGMVELPEGKMKSREGTVVDADDLMEEMINTARETSQELGKLDNCTEEEKNTIARMVGLGALKYFILKVDPRKNMTFNPKESIDFNGNTGPFIQYTHARIKSVLRKATEQGVNFGTIVDMQLEISEKESYLIQLLSEFPTVVKQAGEEFSPALIANYEYELVKEYNQFYHDFSILKEENEGLKQFRLVLSDSVAKVVKSGMQLLGIEVPERM